MDTWHHEKNPNGITVEMHGNIRCFCQQAAHTSSIGALCQESKRSSNRTCCAVSLLGCQSVYPCGSAQ